MPRSKNSGLLSASVLTTVSSITPVFLAGALGNTLRTQLEISEFFFGMLVGTFFLGAMIGSATVGSLSEKIGAQKTLLAGLTATILVDLYIASAARSGTTFMIALIAAGLANSASQPAVNKLLSQSIDQDKLGFAIAAKQSGMPAAAMLGGLAVPTLALTVGWQWGYVAAAVLASIAWLSILVFADANTLDLNPQESASKLYTPRSILILAAVAGGFASSGAGVLNSWLTSSAEDAGITAAKAGLLLSAGSFIGISVRVGSGIIADRKGSLSPVRIAGVLLLIGAAAVAMLAPRSQALQIFAALLAYGTGWSWPALFNYGIIKANLSAAAQATGITQTGVYLGVFTGPILMGYIVENYSYQLGWLVTAGLLAIGATLMIYVSQKITLPHSPAKVRTKTF